MGDWDSLLNNLNAAALSAFGREVIYKPQAGGEFAIRAIFQPTRQAEENSPGQENSSVYAVIFVRLSDLPQPPHHGDEVMVGASVYKVFGIESDGEGAVTLSLRAE
jgi:hypothetical protein